MARAKKREQPVDVIAAVLCDEVRTEINNKNFLIGVYSGEVILDVIPTREYFSLWLNLTMKTPEAVSFTFRVLDRDNVAIQSLKSAGKLEAKGIGSQAGISLGELPLGIKQPGELRFQMKFDDLDWVTVLSKNFRLIQPGD